ncbi:Homeobox [Macrophomina phaseolina MS6]|uniref:Homeobox n=1 Tax=Macrophomina phaseolina (strain MS6) TaxID=1126212 RepID=K2R918_MACPH|nr:Homeobox [Macrophomina phaseolina MS6]
MAHWFLTDCAAQNLHILDEELLVGITPDNSDGNSGLLLSDFWDCDSWAQPLAAYDEAQFPPTLPEVPIRNDRFDAPQWLAQPEESTYRLAGTTFELLGATAEHEMEENIEAWMDNAMFEMQEDKQLDQYRLAQETGLNKKQIKVWFNNRRSRHLQRNDVTLTHDVHDLTLWRNTQTPLHLTASNLDEMQQNFDPATSPSPLATYIDTPLSEDPAQLAAIQKQAASLPRIDSQSSTTSHRYQPYSRVNSAQSIGSSGGSCDSLQSHSRSSNRGARKGRRLYTETQQAENEAFVPNLSKSAAYFCTFCGKELRDRYQWKRHEESLHVPRSLWVCDLAPCPEQKDVDERTFMRRDQYVQHVGIVHGRKSEDIVKNARIDAPDIPPGHPALKCGFCGKVCAGWSNRVNHVLRHFQEGMKLTSWWLGRLMFEDFMPRLWELEKPAM